MRLKRFILPALLLLTLTGSALAEEIVYFTNGTSMPIRKHEIKGDMIHVDLGGDAFMAFPMRMVDKIESAGKTVMLSRSSGGSNIISATGPDPSGNYPVRGSYPGHRGKKQETRIISKEELNQMENGLGLQVHRPMAGHEAQNRRALGVTSRTKAIQVSGGGGGEDGGMLGTRKVGTRHVIGADTHRRDPSGKPLPAAPLDVSHRASSGAKKSGSGN
jgi:hypothetical protein